MKRRQPLQVDIPTMARRLLGRLPSPGDDRISYLRYEVGVQNGVGVVSDRRNRVVAPLIAVTAETFNVYLPSVLVLTVKDDACVGGTRNVYPCDCPKLV